MELKKALIISQEIAPYLEETPMSSWSRDLAQGLKERGAEVRAFMPKYGYINERRNQLHEVYRLSGMNIIIDDTDHPLIIKTATLLPSRISVFFIYNDDYFILPTKNKKVESLPEDATPQEINQAMYNQLETVLYHENNHERSIFFVRAAVEALRKQRWSPEVIQCNGWMTALVPLYMRELFPDDPSFRDAKIVYALWDDDFTEPMSERFGILLHQDGISDKSLHNFLGKAVDHTMLTRLALEHSDAVIQCSPNIKPEVLDLVQQSGLPFLPYSTEENPVEAVAKFYESL